MTLCITGIKNPSRRQRFRFCSSEEFSMAECSWHTNFTENASYFASDAHIRHGEFRFSKEFTSRCVHRWTGVNPLEGRTHRLLETAPGSHGTACARFVGCPRRVLEEIGPLLIQEHLTAITHAGQADANSRVPSRALRIHRILMPRLYGSPRQAPRTVRISDADV